MSYRRWNSAPIVEYHRSETFPMMNDKDGKNRTDDGKAVADEDISGRHTVATLDTTTAAVDHYVEEESHDDNQDPQEKLVNKGPGCGRGIVADYKRTVGTHWKEEMINLNLKVFAVSFFLFFACIAPAITFGAVYEKATNNWIGAVEMITATSWCGIVYALIGGQPMMINGGTGPVLAFTEILVRMADSMNVPFLTFNAWIGIWVFIYMVIAAFGGLNRIIAYASRFTDEIFSLLISFIFIINALYNPFAPVGVFYYFDPDHKSHDEHEDDPDYSYMASALLSLMLCLGTVYLAFLLRKVKFSPFLPNQLTRNFVTDFAVVSSIVVMCLIGNVAFSDVKTETLNVPDSFAPTYSCCDDRCDTNWPDDCPNQSEPERQRPWLVDLFDLNGQNAVPIIAAGPAFLAFILVFLDDGITWHLINHPTHKLKHGEAFNYDTLVIGVMIAINSLLGLPWLVAATVRSLNHIHAMAEKTPDGKIVSVQETRLTNLFIHLLCLASIFALDVLKVIPMPVLYGVFLFMGLVSLGTNQFWGRVLMYFMQPCKYPLEPYTVHMKPKRMHLFTGIQLFLFGLLFVVKSIKTIAIAFPLIIALCIPVRLFLLPKIFSELELVVIDSDDDMVKEYLAAICDAEHKEADSEELVKTDNEPHDEEEDMEEEHEDEMEEVHDQVTPLPDIEQAGEQRRTRRKQRKKTVSCPPHMLFAEVPMTTPAANTFPVTPGPDQRRRRKKTVSCPPHMLFAEVPVSATETRIAVDEERDDSVSTFTSSEATTNARPRRRRRSKSVSCPPHMLFAEAERQVASNYFFG